MLIILSIRPVGPAGSKEGGGKKVYYEEQNRKPGHHSSSHSSHSPHSSHSSHSSSSRDTNGSSGGGSTKERVNKNFIMKCEGQLEYIIALLSLQRSKDYPNLIRLLRRPKLTTVDCPLHRPHFINLAILAHQTYRWACQM